MFAFRRIVILCCTADYCLCTVSPKLVYPNCYSVVNTLAKLSLSSLVMLPLDGNTVIMLQLCVIQLWVFSSRISGCELSQMKECEVCYQYIHAMCGKKVPWC